MKKLNSVTEVGAVGSIIYIRYKRRQRRGADQRGGKFRKVGNEEAGKENLKIKKKTKLKMFIPIASSTHFPKAIFKLFV